MDKPSNYHYDLGLELANLIEHEADCAGTNSFCYTYSGHMTIDHVGIPLDELGRWMTEAMSIVTSKYSGPLHDANDGTFDPDQDGGFDEPMYCTSNIGEVVTRE